MDPALKPRFRGVFHEWAFFLALGAAASLLLLANGAREVVAVTIYTAALAAMFGASALYHRVPWRSDSVRAWMRRLDHSMVFVFIAGTYTAVALLGFDGTLQVAMIVAVWAGTALGLLLNLVWIEAPRILTAAAYLMVGWVGVIALPSLFSALGVAGGVLLLTGGAIYSLGALTYALRWPNPFPATFGFHEVFHVLVVAAAAVQFVAVALVVS